MSAVPLATPPLADEPAALAELALRACVASRPAPGHAMLLDALLRATGTDFALRLSRGGWYRPGRILDAAGQCVADDAMAWLEQAWADADEDPQAFAERHADSGLTVTRLDGSTHYFVAPNGPGAADFLQLEVEELRERVSHRFDAAAPAPDSVEAMIAPAREARSLRPSDGTSHYGFRRITDIARITAALAAQPGSAPPVLRFLAEWDASSSGRQRRFCDHWVLALSDHPDRYGQPRRAARPVPTHAPHWSGADGAAGLALAQHLHDFNRDAGYRAAWYFHLVCGHRVPRSVAPAVFADLQDGMAYLPERDVELLKAWMREPYSL
jgi:hypothetical protein